MKLGKSAIASVISFTEATVNELVKNEYLSVEHGETILNAFKQVSSKGDTAVIALLAVACIGVLDFEANQDVTNAINARDLDIPKANSLNYTVLNKVDESINS